MSKKFKDVMGGLAPKKRPDAGGAPKEGSAPKAVKALKYESPIEPTKAIITPFDTERIEVETIDRSDWQDLTGETGDKPEPFPMMALPKEARDFCEAVSSSMGTPQDFAALGILGAMACAIGASTRLEVKAGWQEFAVLWLALCARPGAAKSPSLNACFKPIRGIQQELNIRYSQAMSAYREKVAQAKNPLSKELPAPPVKQAKKFTKQEVMKFEASTNPVTQAKSVPASELPAPPVTQAKYAPVLELPVKPVAEFLLLGDITQEALVRTLSESPRGGAILSDELTGWLGSHDKYSKGGNDRQAYLSLWSSLPLSVHRKLDGVVTVNLPVLSVIGGLTPSSLPRLHGGQEDGFLSRVLVACPEERQATYTKQGITAAQALAYGAFIRKLWELAPEHQDEHGITPKTIVLSEEAEEVFEAFYNEMQQALSGDAIPGVMRGSFSKSPSQVARIALVLHCARNVSEEESDPYRLSADTMEAAIEIVKYFLSHLKALEGSLHHSFTRSQEIQSRVIEWLRSFQNHCKGVDAGWTELRHGCRRALALPDGKIDDRALEECLLSLEANGVIKLINRRSSRRILKPLIAINPFLGSAYRPNNTNNPKIGEII